MSVVVPFELELITSVVRLQPHMVIMQLETLRWMVVTDVNVRHGYCDVEAGDGRIDFLEDPIGCHVFEVHSGLSAARAALQMYPSR